MTVVELKTEVQTLPPAEKEKEAVLPTKAPLEIPAEPKLAPGEMPAAHQKQPTPEPETASKATPKPALELTPELPADQPTQISNMVYVEGFGWIESQGPNYVSSTPQICMRTATKSGSWDKLESVHKERAVG